jgi:hypothetical protein
MSTGITVPFFVMLIEREHLLQTALQQTMSASDNDLRYYNYAYTNIYKKQLIPLRGVRKLLM